MKHRVIAASSVAAQAWRNGGGQTRELLAWPAGSDWKLRISRADIEKDGPFSAFPGVRRWFAVLEGAGVVLHMPEGPRTLHRGDAPFAFDGGRAPDCTLIEGATQDLNLMVQHGQGTLQSVSTESWSGLFQMRGLYTAQAGHWSNGTEAVEMPPHSLLWVDQLDESTWTFMAQDTNPPHAWWIGFSPTDPT